MQRDAHYMIGPIYGHFDVVCVCVCVCVCVKGGEMVSGDDSFLFA